MILQGKSTSIDSSKSKNKADYSLNDTKPEADTGHYIPAIAIQQCADEGDETKYRMKSP
ncbi:hypothetical protein M5X11_16590 [Paenibacillus alginolyticus]|uniref:hypothetical protein n=1 Tax=Paenibacillus alginolyticus TaxID=59839 RepID=UPI000428F2B1|nr:hypothetical protein [Paenibacillus alginolyticus]MCY9666535.1 hypothetical protein [Paenibacillus alginolyticus]